MAASATEISWTAVTMMTGMSGYFSFERSSSAIPSNSAIMRSESISSNSPVEFRMASASIPEEACRVLYPAALSMDEMISRIGSSSSTTRMRSVAIWKFTLGGTLMYPRVPGNTTPKQEKNRQISAFYDIQEYPHVHKKFP